jgi:hypothetical protein
LEIFRWIAWGAGIVVAAYLTIVILFALYFALAAYVPMVGRKLRALLATGAGESRGGAS